MQETKRSIPEQPLLQFLLRDRYAKKINARKLLPVEHLAKEVDDWIHYQNAKP
jgi:hypothetical protein